MNLDLYKNIDQYCERIGTEFWAEPINAVSNGFFIVAAFIGFYWALQIPRDVKAHRWIAVLLSGLVFCIGVGSFLFHTFANVWSLFADVFPITIFMLVFFGYFLRMYFRFSGYRVALFVAGFMAVGFGLDYFLPKAFLNGSGGYLHAWASLVIFGHLIRDSHKKSARLFIYSIAIFTISLGFRSMDHAICESFPLGTHFLWHTLNALLLGILLRVPPTYIIESQSFSAQIEKKAL